MSASTLRALMLGWMRRVARSPQRERLVLRGSLLTSAWCPGRPTADVDHLVLEGFRDEEARALVEDLLEAPDDTTSFDLGTLEHAVIWADTASPGLRTKIVGSAISAAGDGAEALLQIDLGQGDTLAIPPVAVSLDGNPTVLGVTPETMYGWKTDGLFEFGHGSWRAKDLYDLWLIDRHVALDHDALVIAVRAAFACQEMELSVADRFLFTDVWGRSRGSRRRWESFGRRTGLTATLPDLREAIGAARGRLLPVFAALGHATPSHALERTSRDHREAPQEEPRHEREPDE